MDLQESIAALEEFLSCLKAREVPRMFSEEAERAAKCTDGYRYFTRSTEWNRGPSPTSR